MLVDKLPEEVGSVASIVRKNKASKQYCFCFGDFSWFERLLTIHRTSANLKTGVQNIIQLSAPGVNLCRSFRTKALGKNTSTLPSKIIYKI